MDILQTILGLVQLGLGLLGFMPMEHTSFAKEVSVYIKDTAVFAEVADSPAELAKGLMFRTKLDKDRGMLFIFPNEGKHPFWMANTKIPLDIIWINSEMEIVYISKSTPPCEEPTKTLYKCPSYKSIENAKYVLEVNGGWADTNDITKGEIVQFEE